MATLVLTIRFFLELAMLAAFVAAGHGLLDGPAGWVVGAALAGVALTIWSIWVAPKAPRRLDPSARTALEMALFTTAAALLFATGHATSAGLLLIIYAVDTTILLKRGITEDDFGR